MKIERENFRRLSAWKAKSDRKPLILQGARQIGKTWIIKSTLIIFDEIQECNKALNSLKYFCEDAPEYAIIAAGSLLGVSLSKGDSFPVGKVDFMQMYPLTFNITGYRRNARSCFQFSG